MASLDLSHFADAAQDRIGRQLSSLARDTQHLSDVLARYTDQKRHDLGHVAHELADEALQQGAVAAQVLGKQAWKMGKAVRRDPVPAVAAVVGVACLLSLVMSSGARR